jgi:hypothetical protein
MSCRPTLWSRVVRPNYPVGMLLSDVTPSAGMTYKGLSSTGIVLTTCDAASGAPARCDRTAHIGISWDLSAAMTPLLGAGAVYLVGV